MGCCDSPEPNMIPLDRVIYKLDSLLDRKDFEGAERHLNYWLRDAEALGDKRGQLAVVNEQIGFYRKTGRELEAIVAAETALSLAEEAGLNDNAVMGTTLINAATAYKAFDYPKRALPLYERAKEIYDKLLSPNDKRMGGLYNNMATTLTVLGRTSEAEVMFKKAIEVMAAAGCDAEVAVTYCNMADLYTDTVQKAECLNKAFALLSSEAITRDGNYAFVCEKCAPTFEYYGFTEYSKVLSERARSYYEGT